MWICVILWVFFRTLRGFFFDPCKSLWHLCESMPMLVALMRFSVNPCQCLWLVCDPVWIPCRLLWLSEDHHMSRHHWSLTLYESLWIFVCVFLIICVLHLLMNHNFDIKNPFFLSLSLYVCVCVYEYIALGSERQTLHKHIWICWVFESWELMLVFVNVYKSLYECMWICVILCANNLNLASSMQKYANVWPNICKCM